MPRDVHDEVLTTCSEISTTPTTTAAMVTPTTFPVSDLVDSVRRLSISSNASSLSTASVTLSLQSHDFESSEFSILSAAPSVQSLDSHGSIIGGVTVNEARGQTSHSGTEFHAHQHTSTITIAPIISGASLSLIGSRKSKSRPCIDESASFSPKASPFWYQFPGFNVNPTATFKDEFASLAKHQAWGTKAKRKRQVEALNAEIIYFHGTCMQRLDRWQELCEAVGIVEIPTSITQCKKVFNFIKPIAALEMF